MSLRTSNKTEKLAGSSSNLDLAFSGLEKSPMPGNPSDEWSSYSDSVLSGKHLTDKDKQMRTSTFIFTAANVAKMYVGISLIAVSKSIANVGM